jgi:hypothetical protein
MRSKDILIYENIKINFVFIYLEKEKEWLNRIDLKIELKFPMIIKN